MRVLVATGDLPGMTHLSIKALRFYRDQGLLEPANGPGGGGHQGTRCGVTGIWCSCCGRVFSAGRLGFRAGEAYWGCH